MLGLGLIQLLKVPFDKVYSFVLDAGTLATWPLSAVLKMVKLIASGFWPGEDVLQSLYNFSVSL